VSGVEYFFWLATQAIELTIYFFPIALLILGGGVSAPILFGSVPIERRRYALIGAAFQLAVPVIILFCGVFFRRDAMPDAATPKYAARFVEGMLLFHLILAAILIVRLRGARWFTLAVAVAVFAYSWAAAAMSMMSVTGLWL
jgi:hypothetical protein